MNRNPIGQKALSLLLSLTLVLSIFGVDMVGAYAAQNTTPTVLSLDSGNILITDSGYSVGGGPITAQGPADSGYFITQNSSTTPHTISVVGTGTGVAQNITIQNVNIDVSTIYRSCAFSIAVGAAVNLTLEGTNTLKNSRLNAGLQVPGDGVNPPDTAGNAFLTVMAQSTGSLTVTGNSGIGGGEWNDQLSGSITINGGTVTATGSGGAGIGGGSGGGGGTITINGGSVTAAGGASGGAGIGGGTDCSRQTFITINGGTVMATGGAGGGAGIGGGWHFSTGGSGGRIMIYGGTVTATGGVGGAGIGGGDDCGAGGDVTVSGTDTQVICQGLAGGKDVGSGNGPSAGGNLAVSDGATLVMRNEFPSFYTNASKSYADCQIITGSNELKYDSNGTGTPVTLLTAALTTKPASGGQTGSMQFTAKSMNGSTSVTDGTFTFAYSGAKSSGTLADNVTIQSDGTASCTWTPPTDGLTVVTAKYKDSGNRYDALKVVYYYNPDMINIGTVSSGGFGYTYANNTVTINQNGTYVFTGSTSGTTANKIAVQTGVSADVTLSDVHIDASTNDTCPFSIAANASVNLTLAGTNALQSGEAYAALGVPTGACLTVTAQSSGTLDAAVRSNSTTNGAGIGGCGHGTGTIIINGGRITANSSNNYNGFGAGIGGGVGDAGGIIKINDGTITATGYEGAAIGGGGSNHIAGAGGNITINGGTVKATGHSGAGIGGGSGDDTGGAGGTVIINGGKITADGSNGSYGGISAGIGGGYGGSTGGVGGIVTVNGGFVTAKHGSNSKDIGGGTSGTVGMETGGGPVGADGTNVFRGGSIAADSVSPQPVVSTGSPTKVYKTSAQIPGVSAETPVTCTVNGYSFVTQTDAQGFLYVWLPEAPTATYSILNGSTAVSYLARGAVNPAVSVNPLSVFCTADADLAGLTIQGQPAVFNGTDTYSCSFGNSVAALAKSDFVLTFHGTGDTWKLCGDSSCTQELSSLNLNTGENTAYLQVTAQDGTTVKTYQLQITRGTSSNANLAGLSVKANGENIPLSPAFGADILNYTANVGSGVSEVTVAPAVSEPSAAFTVNGKTPVVGQTGVNITLNGVGQTSPISVKVTAQDGTTVKIYTLNIVRAASSTPIPTPSNSSGVSSHRTPAPSLPPSLTNSPTSTTVDLSGATFPASVTAVSLAVTPEAANGAPSVPGNAGLPADPQGAAVFHLVISQTDLNLIDSPFVYNIQLLDQNGNPITSFSGTVTVKVAIPAGIHGTPHIFRYEESMGTLTDLGATVQDGYLVFTTTHFSYYVIAGTGDSITLDTKCYQMPVGESYQIGVRLTGSKAATVKFHSTNDKTATATRLKNGNIQVTAKRTGTAYIMIDVYDSKNHLLTHASVRVDVKTGIRPRGDSTRQIGVF